MLRNLGDRMDVASFPPSQTLNIKDQRIKATLPIRISSSIKSIILQGVQIQAWAQFIRQLSFSDELVELIVDRCELKDDDLELIHLMTQLERLELSKFSIDHRQQPAGTHFDEPSSEVAVFEAPKHK